MKLTKFSTIIAFMFILLAVAGMLLSTAATKPVSGQDSVTTVVKIDSTITPDDTVEVTIETTPSDTTFEFYQRGGASWYGDPNGRLDPYHGRKTASGVKFDTYRMWCAHKTLPHGSWIRVSTKTDTVIVQVVDRGPFVKGRVVDLSWAAAQKIGMSGTANVTIDLVQVNGKPLVTDIDGIKVTKKIYKKKSKKH